MLFYGLSQVQRSINLKKTQQNLSSYVYCMITPWNFTQITMKCILFTMSEKEINTKQFKYYVYTNLSCLKRKGKSFPMQLYFFSISVKQNEIVLAIWKHLSSSVTSLFSSIRIGWKLFRDYHYLVHFTKSCELKEMWQFILVICIDHFLLKPKINIWQRNLTITNSSYLFHHFYKYALRKCKVFILGTSQLSIMTSSVYFFKSI